MYKSNEIKVPKKQKIIAYILLFLVIITFSTMRSQKTKKIIENNFNLVKSVESSISGALNYLYNENLKDTESDYIADDYKEFLINTFEETNSIMSEESLKLSYIKLNRKNTYNTILKGEPFIIYSGTVDLQWSYTNKDFSTDILTKEITVYLKNNKDDLKVADIKLNDKK